MPQDPLNLVCVEPHFPGRLGAVADWLVRKRGYRCRFFCSDTDSRDLWPRSVGHGLDVLASPVVTEGPVEWVRCLERGLGHAMTYFEAIEKHRPRPIDLVLGRSNGLGSTLFVPVHQPGVPVVNLFDYFYHPHRNDLAEEVGPDMPVTYRHWRRSASVMDLLDLENGVTPWTLTRWQRDLYPPEYRDDFLVHHDGIATERFRRESRPGWHVPRSIAGRTLTPQARVVTFVARYLDQVRGFDLFLELADRLLRARSDVVCVVLGNPIVHRGLDVQFFNQDYRSHLLSQMQLYDPGRLWFFDQAQPRLVADALAASDLHVYPSRPYPVSRSLLEAMAAGRVVLAADTEPAREVLTHGETGFLLDPTDTGAWDRQALAVLDDPAAYRPLGEAAATLVQEKYSQEVCLPPLAELFTRLVNGEA